MNEGLYSTFWDGVFQRLGFRLQTGAIEKLFDGDITRALVSVRGESVQAILINTQHAYEVGNYVHVLTTAGKNYILGLVDSFVDNQWFDTTDPTRIRQPQGPIPGLRVPIDNDSLWVDLAGDPTEVTQGNHNFVQRHDVNDLSSYRVIVGNVYKPPPSLDPTTPSAVEPIVPSYGEFIVAGQRIRIRDGLGNIADNQGWCLTGSIPLPELGGYDGASYLAGARVGWKPLYKSGVGPISVVSGSCDPAQTDKTSLYLGQALVPSQSDGFSLTFRFYCGLNLGVDGDIFYGKLSRFLVDKYFIFGVRDGKFALGLSRSLLDGVPSYNSESEHNISTSHWFTFSLPTFTYERVTKYIPDHTKKNWVVGGILFSPYYTLQMSYKSNGDGTSTLTYRASSGSVDDPPEGVLKTVILTPSGVDSGELLDGFNLDSLECLAGDYPGVRIDDQILITNQTTGDIYRNYAIAMNAPVQMPPVLAGEMAWHRGHSLYVNLFDPDLDFIDRTTDPTFLDVLPTGLYIATRDNRWGYLRLSSPVLNSDGTLPVANPDGSTPIDGSIPIFDPNLPPINPDHADLGKLGPPADDHKQYHNDARALTWLATRSTADLPDSANKRYVTDAQVTTIGNAQQIPTAEDVSDQIDGITRSFTTAAVFTPRSLQVKINSLILRNGTDFTEFQNHQGFEIDLRTPQITSPKDVLTVGYQLA